MEKMLPGNKVQYPFQAPLGIWKPVPTDLPGNTVVVKPPLEAPLTVLRLAELLSDAGLPPSTLQVLPGDGPAAGDALARHPVVDAWCGVGGVGCGDGDGDVGGCSFKVC